MKDLRDWFLLLWPDGQTICYTIKKTKKTNKKNKRKKKEKENPQITNFISFITVYFFPFGQLTLVLLPALGTDAVGTVSSLTGRLQGSKYIEAYTVWVNNIILASKEHISQAYKHKTSHRERGIWGIVEETEIVSEKIDGKKYRNIGIQPAPWVTPGIRREKEPLRHRA